MDSGPAKSGRVRTEEEDYVESLVSVSLLLATQESREVQDHGSKMLQHLLKHRSEKLGSAHLLKLKLQYNDTVNRLLVLSLESDGRGNNSSSIDGSSPEKSDGSRSSMPDIKATGTVETASFSHGMGCLLLTEHNLLCEAFVTAASSPGIQQCSTNMLPCILDSLNGLWIQREWNRKYLWTPNELSDLFSDCQFLKISYRIVKFCEEKLAWSVKKEDGRAGACDVFPTALLQSAIPLFLRLLRCIHELWGAEIGVGWLAQDLEEAKTLSCKELDRLLEIPDGLYTIDSEESFRENETRALLEGTRQGLYNFIGLCMTVEGAFPKLLDSLSVSNALMEALGCMDFMHLGKLIHLVVVPLVKHCPYELWEEWTVNFLKPVLLWCGDRLHIKAWFYLLYDIQADNFFNHCNLVGEDEQIEKLRYKLLLEFTRKMSGLLEALALTEQTSDEYVKPGCNKETVSSQDMTDMSQSSLFRFLLRHDCFGKLRMSLFGYFVDDETAKNALQFCRCLIRYAVSANDVRLRLLIVDDLLPCLIRRLDDQLQCAVQRLRHRLRSSTAASADQELLVLCEDVYVYLIRDYDGEDKDRYIAENNFKSWLTKQMGNLRVKACSATKELPDGSHWNWEFEDEFQRYLPAYMEMLQLVDSMDFCYNEDDYLKQDFFQKLGLEFRYKYGINSCEHPYMVTISSLRRRQFKSMIGILYQREKIKFISELIKLKPYIKFSDCSSVIICRLQENSEILSENPTCEVFPSLDLMQGVLSIWEPVFHPLIRESHMAILLQIVDQYIKANEIEHCQQVVPTTLDFEVHLHPYVCAFFETKLEENMYHRAVEQLRLHKEFDSHLASGALDHHMDEFVSSKDDFVKSLVKDEMAGMEFSDLDHDLIKLSLERRAENVGIRRQICTYSCRLWSLLGNTPLRGHIDMLMNELETGGFFDTNNDFIDWEKERFSELVNQFAAAVFAGHSLPKHYVVRGIMDYRSILLCNCGSEVNALEAVVGTPCASWIESCEMFWRETRYYEHTYYDIVRRPLEHVLMK